MFKPRCITNLITPMRQLNIFRTPTITTIALDPIPTPFEKHSFPDPFNDQNTKNCIEKPQKTQNATKKNKTGPASFEKCSCSEPIDNQSTKNHIEKPPKTQNTAKKDKIGVLVSTLFDLNDSKEAVYGALDAWVASEREFPIGRLKTALVILERKREWHRIVHVIKWMLSKGQGVTVGTYGQLIHALDMDQRVEEAHKIWVEKLGRDAAHLVPWKVCDVMISVYHRNDMNRELVKLFKGLEAHGRKPPDESVLRKVAESYEKLGLFEEKERVLEKYKSLFSEKRGKHGRRLPKRVSKSADSKSLLTTDEVTETC